MLLPWILCAVFILIIIFLVIKIALLRKSADEIRAEFTARLENDTNTLISISGGDRHMKRLAAGINVQLRQLRNQRRQYLIGDRELKEAVTNISHDLRTPLTAIFGYLELLEREDKSEEAERYLCLIAGRAQALKQLTGELFRYSVIVSAAEDMHLESVNINSVLEDSIAVFYTELTGRRITPVIHMPEKEVSRNLNRAALSRIFNNILNNALKYSDGDLEITLLDGGTITFVNTASKLNEIQVGKLFDRFYTVEAARNSTGLGLAISKTLAEQMNGKVTAQYTDKKLCICVSFGENLC